MLKLECLFFASLKDAAGCSKTRLELVEGSTVGQLIEALEAQFPRIGALSAALSSGGPARDAAP